MVLVLGVGYALTRWPSNANAFSANSQNSSSKITKTTSTKPLDTVSSSEVAVQIAKIAALEESTAVINKSDSEKAELSVPIDQVSIVNKPQVISTGLKSKKDIKTYTTAEGDTITSVASKFAVTEDTIRYSNDLSGDAIPAQTKLKISPVNGLVYTVKEGDTPDTLAAKYQANREQLIAFNDAELKGGFTNGEEIVIPDAVQPIVRSSRSGQPNMALSNSSSSLGRPPQWGGNGYDYGYCTWYVANRRPVPTNWGNANTWDEGARAAGMVVSKNPIPGSILQDEGSLYGTYHVAYVEAVYPDGSIKVSEMNVRGWNKESSQVWSAEAYKRANIDFIY